MNHDVIDDRYGRLFELPHCLSRSTSVMSFCLDYRLEKKAPIPEDLVGFWFRLNIPLSLFVGWFLVLFAKAKEFRPDCVIASSDCVSVIIGRFIAYLLGARFYADLYDDYSTFGLAKIPGMKWLYQRALRNADGICAVSETLGSHLRESFPAKPVLVLESTIDAATFYPRDKSSSLKLLGLDGFCGKKLVGVCGGLNAYHGVSVVFDAFAKISELEPEVLFVVAGKLDDAFPLPQLPNIEYLGVLTHEQMPYFFSAIDVQVVALSNTRFGYFAFPQKAYEVLACEVPVAAAEVGALALLFDAVPEALYDPDSSSSLAATVVRQLQAPKNNVVDIPTWEKQALSLGRFISTV